MELHFTLEQWRALQAHLVPNRHDVEEAAFAFMSSEGNPGQDLRLTCLELRLLTGPELSHQSSYHIEVSEEAQAQVIKRAHDLGACMVELHSHVFDPGPEFSASDWAGFKEFVPHVYFRLKGKPYAAIVMSASGVDAIGWELNATSPERVAVYAGDQLVRLFGPSAGTIHRGRTDGR